MLAEKIAVDSSVRYHYRLQREGQDVAATDDRLFIHFEIFDILRREIKTRDKIEHIDQLATISENTHNWALSIIEDQFVSQYKDFALKCKEETMNIKKLQ